MNNVEEGKEEVLHKLWCILVSKYHIVQKCSAFYSTYFNALSSHLTYSH